VRCPLLRIIPPHMLKPIASILRIANSATDSFPQDFGVVPVALGTRWDSVSWCVGLH
jgi:hypothetical protein